MDLYILLLYIFFGILPSLLWLFYYLLKDLHPEPKRMIIRMFIFGSAVTIPVYLVQVGLGGALSSLEGIPLFAGIMPLFPLLKWFVVIALTEEIAIYLLIKHVLLHNGELDEPLDIMLYMVVAALGFAAVENILYLFSPLYGLPFVKILSTTVQISFIRFIGATFLHTLCSALIGYFLVKSLSDHNRFIFISIGILLATLLHGFYDFSIMTLSNPFNLLVSSIVLAVLALFMLYDFDEVQKLKGICKL